MSLKILQQLRCSYLAYGQIRSKILLKTFDISNCINQATAAFGISTIVLGVNNADLRSQLDEIPTTTTTTTTTTTAASPSSTTEEPTVTENPENMSKYRLPTSAVPTKYDLYLFPDLLTGLFRGKVTAMTNIQETTNEIVMHSNQLNINEVFVNDNLGSFEVDQQYELLTVRKTDGSEFSQGSVVNITVDFDGDMKNRIVGLYTSSYTNAVGDVRYMATSKFEPTYARQAYPCFDEPNLKATYKVHLLKPKDSEYIALSNYPQEPDEEEVPEGVMVHFDETVAMSTYLSCFIVSDFKHTATSFDNGGTDVPFRVYASSDQLDKTNYAGTVGKLSIEYYIKYFNIPYPLPKLDMVAIPDFVSGAMEHWGLVTYRETALLYDPKTHSVSNKQRVAEVVAHELAHSWFGNLVTMDWWNNLWLNEGFATYIAVKGVSAAEPSWQMLDQFLTSTLHSILSLDATQASHPIIQTVQTPDQITEVFDSVSYNKGASVLRMLESVVNPDNFQNGVTNYLKEHQYGNAITQDLWDEIQKVVGDKLNITEFMDTFTVQMGYPILDATVDGNKYTFRQKRFLKDYESAATQKRSPLNYKWNVPVTYITDLGPSDQIHWFKYDQDELVVEKPAGAKWIKFNPNQIGYYRVNYVEDDWNTLSQNIKDLSVADKAHLLEESFSIAESGELTYKIPLSLTKYLVDETNYVPWSVASSKLTQIANYMETSQYHSEFKTYIINLLKPAYDELTWDDTDANEEDMKKLARVAILSLACALDYNDALEQAKTQFNDWISDTSLDISPNLRSIIYRYGMVTADESTWNKLFEVFAQESDANEKLKLMNGLANIRIPSLLIKLIELAKDEMYVRSQDYFTLLQYISANPVGRPIVWDYVRENWSYLVDRFTLNDRYLGRLIPSITGRFSTDLKVDEMQYFFAKYPEAGAGESARRQALEAVTNNIKWLNKHKKEVEDWIVENKDFRTSNDTVPL
ncbi:glutamyl aminopeptidase isoform X1 [Tenebrio molitor]|uniref:glutamyl aminopeptidase isoform X1 n=2 Tax=Tenebrio molitor TaxID=7067 RepID=UPI003624778F